MGGVAHGAHTLQLGSTVPVRRGTPGWTWVVAHIVAGRPTVSRGSAVKLAVNEARRRTRSAGHTACELQTLASSVALSERWRKDVPRDHFDNPAFEALAIAASQISPHGSRATGALVLSPDRQPLAMTSRVARPLPAGVSARAHLSRSSCVRVPFGR